MTTSQSKSKFTPLITSSLRPAVVGSGGDETPTTPHYILVSDTAGGFRFESKSEQAGPPKGIEGTDSDSKAAPSDGDQTTQILSRLALKLPRQAPPTVGRSSVIPRKGKSSHAKSKRAALLTTKSNTPALICARDIRALGDGRMLARHVLGLNPYRSRLGTVLVANTSSVGVINFAIQNSSLSGLTEFASFASLFDEFFVHSMDIMYVPRSRYQYVPAETSPATSVVNTLLTVTPLFHGTSGYASAATAMENERTEVHSTADPFKFSWRNNESPTSGVVVAASSSSVIPSQGWCLTTTSPASLYQGTIQALGATPIGPGTGVVSFADIAVVYDVSFRVRA